MLAGSGGSLSLALLVEGADGPRTFRHVQIKYVIVLA